jgi:hypothetical protein
MGYMGFGMRKEDYKRTPNKSFDKIKNKYGVDLNLPKVDGKPNEDIPNRNVPIKRFKHFYQTRVFKIIFFTFLTFTTGYLVWDLLLAQLIKKRQIHEFETTGIINYYNDNKPDFLLIKEYISERSDRILNIGFDSDTKAYNISIRDRNLTDTVSSEEINYYYRYGLVFPYNSNDKIDNGKLVLKDKLIDKNWIYTFTNVKLEQIDKSFIKYIDDLPTNFHKISTLIKEKEIEVIYDSMGTSISFNYSNYGLYSIMFTDKVLSNIENELIHKRLKTKFVQLDNGVYWIRN